jgi:Ca2+-binding EF-hand superfamily protein
MAANMNRRKSTAKGLLGGKPGLKPGFGLNSDKPKWLIENEEAKTCFINDEQLTRAKEAFFKTDRDGSGSIDRDELGFMLKSLGQKPSEDEITKMMQEADQSNGLNWDGGNGKIEMREFLKWYGKLYNQGKNQEDEEIMDAYSAFGSTDAATPIPKEKISSILMEQYGLEIDVDDVFPSTGNEVTHEAFSKVLAAPKGPC